MSRDLIRSNYDAGEPAWLDWVVVGLLVLFGVGELLTGGETLIAMTTLLAGLGFGIFVTIVELGMLRRPDRRDSDRSGDRRQ